MRASGRGYFATWPWSAHRGAGKTSLNEALLFEAGR